MTRGNSGGAEAPSTQKRKLALPLVQAGVERKPGETVELGARQIEWLEPLGYFETPGGSGAGKKEDGK